VIIILTDEKIFILGWVIALIMVCVAGIGERILDVSLIYSLFFSYIVLTIIFSKTKKHIYKFFEIE